jgi:hypothetical protein
MTSGSRRRSIAFFIVFGVCLTAAAPFPTSANIDNFSFAADLGVLIFPVIITGVVLNTIFVSASGE